MKDKLILAVGVTTFILCVLGLPKAIKFFFRGLLLLMEYPLEAFCFIGITTLIYSACLWVESEEKKVEKKL